MKKRVCYFGIATAVIALAILFIWIKLNSIPAWVEKNDRDLFVDEKGLSLISNHSGKIEAFDENGEAFWSGEESWTVQDVLWEDVDNDNKEELLLLVWKKGRYGQAKPFWVKNDEIKQSQHIFIYDWDENKKRFDPLWMASDILVDAKNLYFDKENKNLFIEDINGKETVWKWDQWGLKESDEIIHFLAVGDNLIHFPIYKLGLEKDSFKFLYDHIKSEIASADIACINQETPLVKTADLYGDYPSFGTPYEVADAMKQAGFDVVSCATNHSYDREMTGIDATIETFNNLGMLVTGIQGSKEKEYVAFKVLEKKEIKFAFLNYTESLNGIKMSEDYPYAVHRLKDEQQIIDDISLAKKEADFVIVFAHWGTEYEKEPDENQRKWTDLFLQSGVDVVIGTHPHVLQPYEILENKDGHKMLVYYSLGNFMSAQDKADCIVGGMANITFSLTRDGYQITDFGMDEIVTHQETEYYSVFKMDSYPNVMKNRHRLKNLFPDW